MQQLLDYEKNFNTLLFRDERMTFNFTACRAPCTYTEFKEVGHPKNVHATGYGLWLRFAKTEMVEDKEAYVYGFVSFVSEFGGSLGLFLGFSFLMVWEFIEPLVLIGYQKMNKK